MKEKFEWELIQEFIGDGMINATYRAKVPGGWIVRHKEYFIGTTDMPLAATSSSMTLLPDPEHKWEVA